MDFKGMCNVTLALINAVKKTTYIRCENNYNEWKQGIGIRSQSIEEQGRVVGSWTEQM